MNGEEMREVDKYKYLGVMISTDGGMGEEVGHRILEGRKNGISREVKPELYERVVVIKCTGEK